MGQVILAEGAYALSAVELKSARRPVIGWRNLVTFTNIAADTETVDDPASNLSNPSTSWRWTAATTADQYVTVLFGGTHFLNYAGIERHNWSSGVIPASLEALPAGGDPEDDGDWVEVVQQVTPDDDGALMWLFTRTAFIGLRWKLEPGAVVPFAAVAFCGELVVLKKGVPPGHTPITFGDVTEQRDLGAQGGDHLGIAIIGRSRSGNIVQQNLDPDWYRDTLEPFRLAFRNGQTFFFAWAPQRRPNEIGYCWRAGDATPVVSQTTGHIDITFPIKAVAL